MVEITVRVVGGVGIAVGSWFRTILAFRCDGDNCYCAISPNSLTR